jgi:hypothetical protein
MTLVLLLITPTFVAQVSDRLVTRDTLPFDHANTNADGIVSFGYSGPADDPESGALRVPGAVLQTGEAVQ